MLNSLWRYRVTGSLVFLLVGLFACGEPPAAPEQAVRAWIAGAEVEAESKDRAALMARIATSYSDARGYERADLDRLFRIMFLRQNAIALLVDIESITIHQETAADVVLKVAMAGSNNSMLGFSADAYRFELELQLEDDDWLLSGARWGELGNELR